MYLYQKIDVRLIKDSTVIEVACNAAFTVNFKEL